MKTYGNVIVGIAAGVVASCACAATSWTDYFGGTAPASGTVAIAATRVFAMVVFMASF